MSEKILPTLTQDIDPMDARNQYGVVDAEGKDPLNAQAARRLAAEIDSVVSKALRTALKVEKGSGDYSNDESIHRSNVEKNASPIQLQAAKLYLSIIKHRMHIERTIAPNDSEKAKKMLADLDKKEGLVDNKITSIALLMPVSFGQLEDYREQVQAQIAPLEPERAQQLIAKIDELIAIYDAEERAEADLLIANLKEGAEREAFYDDESKEVQAQEDAVLADAAEDPKNARRFDQFLDEAKYHLTDENRVDPKAALSAIYDAIKYTADGGDFDSLPRDRQEQIIALTNDILAVAQEDPKLQAFAKQLSNLLKNQFVILAPAGQVETPREDVAVDESAPPEESAAAEITDVVDEETEAASQEKEAAQARLSEIMSDWSGEDNPLARLRKLENVPKDELKEILKNSMAAISGLVVDNLDEIASCLAQGAEFTYFDLPQATQSTAALGNSEISNLITILSSDASKVDEIDQALLYNQLAAKIAELPTIMTQNQNKAKAILRNSLQQVTLYQFFSNTI